jgi:hypothetical protein
MKEENKVIVADASWADAIPKWVMDEIVSTRMINGMVSITNPESKAQDEVCDAEIVAYLMTASLRAPLNSDVADIYLYVSARLMLKTKKIQKEEDLPDFMQEIYKKGLTDWQKTQLSDLQSKIRTARGKINHPIFDVLKQLKGGTGKNGTIRKEK